MATAELSFDALKGQVTQPLEDMLRQGQEKEQALRGEIEEVWDAARERVAALKEEVATLERELSPAKQMLRKFDPEHELLGEKKQPAKTRDDTWEPDKEHVEQLLKTLGEDGQLTYPSATAVLYEKFDASERTARNAVSWMRQHELIRQAGTVKSPKLKGGMMVVFKPMDAPVGGKHAGAAQWKLDEVLGYVQQNPGTASGPRAKEVLTNMSKDDIGNALRMLAERELIVCVGEARPDNGRAGRNQKLYAPNTNGHGGS